MQIIRSSEFVADRAWGAKLIAKMQGITTKLHWTDQPYKWHINDGQEVFVVLEGQVEMFYKENNRQYSELLQTGDIFYANEGCEHLAHPRGEARVLVIEREGSV